MKENNSIEDRVNILEYVEGVSYSRWEFNVLMQLYNTSSDEQFKKRVEIIIPTSAQLSELFLKILFGNPDYEEC
jgi:hypothetical protein